MEKLKQNTLAQLFIIYTRYLIGSAFVFASIVKILGERFTSGSGADDPIDSAGHLFETLYASGMLWRFMGLGQLVAGFLLMTQRYAKLGAVAFFPIISFVFMFTVNYHFTGTPVITGLMLLANIMLIVWDWDVLRVLVNKPPIINTTKRLENDPVWEITGLALFLFIVIYRLTINGYNFFFWAVICVGICLTGLIIGLTRKKRYNNPLAL